MLPSNSPFPSALRCACVQEYGCYTVEEMCQRKRLFNGNIKHQEMLKTFVVWSSLVLCFASRWRCFLLMGGGRADGHLLQVMH